MDSSLFISLLNPAIALVLASAFLILWLHQRQWRHLAVLSLAYALSGVGFLLQHFTLPVGLPLSRLVSNVCFTIAAICLSGATVARYDRKVPYAALGILGGGGLAAFCWFMFVEPDLTWRIYVMNFAFGGISLVVAAELRAVPDTGPTDRILFALALLSGLNFFVRTLVAVKIHGPYETYEGFYSSLYWTTAILSHAILSLLIAFSLLTAAALDVLKTLKAESHTDPLSGLLNRRGFEARASTLLDRCAAGKLPVALVVADLDRFKALNDRHGHAAGDRVIAEFAARLRTAAGTRGVAGRLGGEEFTVLLPLADLASARLLAEAVRAVFSAETIDGLPRDVRVTASFGVAARDGDECLADLMRRADDALYSAKKGGRDSVRVSYQRPTVNPRQAARLRLPDHENLARLVNLFFAAVWSARTTGGQPKTMSGAGFILAINLFVAGLLAASFMTIAAYDRRRVSARWLALGYVIGMAYFLIEFAISTFGASAFAVVFSFATFLGAMALFNVGVASKYDVPAPWLTMTVVFVVSVAICILILDMPRQSFTRMLLYQAPYFGMQAIAVGIVGQAKERSQLDSVLMALLAASALQFLSKAFLFQAFGGTGATEQDYLTTNYALFSQSMGTIFAMATALLLLVILVRDVLADATVRSETDTLSGLLNRGGFEARAGQALRDASRRGVRVSLVISDLDHFKSVNDGFGHASGDRVIATFAGFLRSAMADHHVAGRIGGEEFAILLPGTNLVAARLFAEGARTAFSALGIEGMPEGKRFTASFGVAELVPGEGIAELLARADKALYIAKNSGRDCVKIAPRPDMRKTGGFGTAIRLG